jgi:hypothetical protein
VEEELTAWPSCSAAKASWAPVRSSGLMRLAECSILNFPFSATRLGDVILWRGILIIPLPWERACLRAYGSVQRLLSASQFPGLQCLRSCLIIFVPAEFYFESPIGKHLNLTICGYWHNVLS